MTHRPVPVAGHRQVLGAAGRLGTARLHAVQADGEVGGRRGRHDVQDVSGHARRHRVQVGVEVGRRAVAQRGVLLEQDRLRCSWEANAKPSSMSAPARALMPTYAAKT
ncbi:hypothetical protein GCM10017778_54900 [Streptomyces vinaceus]|nr:hypothetical protein GCM10017778_54900 [Streptomyces vinaceus]